MPQPCLHYELHEGYIHNWLVLGPEKILAHFKGDSAAFLPIASDPVVGVEATEPAFADETVPLYGDDTALWQYRRCADDHFVDLSQATGAGQQLAAWAYAELDVPAEVGVEAVLTLPAPLGDAAADVWLDKQHIDHIEVQGRDRENSQALQQSRFELNLAAGRNVVLVRFEVQPVAPCPFAMALQITGGTPVVCLPTSIAALARRNHLEDLFNAAYVDRYVFARDEELQVHWPAADAPEHVPEASANLMMRLRAPSGRIYAEASPKVMTEPLIRAAHAYRYPSGPLDAILMPQVREYYEGGMRISRTFSLWTAGNNRYSETPDGTFLERRREALISAARLEANVYSEIGKVAVGWWSRVDLQRMLETLATLGTTSERDALELIGFLGMALRYGDAPEFPQELAAALAETVPAMPYLEDVDPADPRVLSETASLVVAACEILAGQLYPEAVFADGRTGAWHREQGERFALAWLRQCAARGLATWHSDVAFEAVITVLVHFIDFAEAEELWQTSSVLLDKLLFQLALNSYKGVFGSSRGTTSTAELLGGYMEATSGIAKLMFGLGAFNARIGATVSLACLENYELPVLLQMIAADLPPEGIWSGERHGLPGDVGDVSTVTYKTPNGMLAAALDYRPGTPGHGEHIWQATLGPGATVFVTHPVCNSLDDARMPNFWRGNGVLPRVAQWQDALMALYSLPEQDWLGFTHAYFPRHAFDETTIREGWAFVRKGDGYLALMASQGLTMMRTGDAAYRELRAYGQSNVWLCQMGRAALDGDFEAFQEKVLALPLTVDGLAVRWTTLRGDALAFDWTGPFLKNDEPVPLSLEPLMENRYCVAPFPAEVMDIRYDETVMRLDFRPESMQDIPEEG